MSHDFIRTQVQQNRKCLGCRRQTFSHQGHVYSMCTDHLRKARAAWHKHCKFKRSLGECINCDNWRLRGEQRCASCKERNRLKCLRWSRAHPEVSHQYWLKVRKQYLQAGYCLCKGHPKLPPGYRRCDDCRKRHNDTKRARYRQQSKEAR